MESSVSAAAPRLPALNRVQLLVCLEAHPETGLSEQGEFARRDPFGVRLP